MALEIQRRESDAIQSDVVQRPAHPRLAPYMGGYTGYHERARGRLMRVETPFGGLPLIVSFGPPLRVSDLGGEGGGAFGSFIAGLQEGWVRTEFERESAGVQVNLTPLGAFLLLRRPMHELTNRTLGLDDLLGVEGALLGERIGAIPSWEKRFEVLDELVLSRFTRARPPSADVVRAWQRLVSSAGSIPIASITAEVACSPRHLIDRFHEQIGLAPKTLARVLRFQRAKALLGSGRRALDVAFECGYYDQAHLIRDFREFTGTTPGRLASHLAPELIEMPPAERR